MKHMTTTAACAALLLAVAPAGAQDESWFNDATAAVGLDGLTGLRTLAVDLDGDDYPEVVLINNTETHRNMLSVYLNRPVGGGRGFVDHTAASGINAHPEPGYEGRQANSAAFADLDNDGDPDVVTCVYYHRIENRDDYVLDAHCEVLLNDGAAVFSLLPGNGLHELGLINGSGLAFLDYDPRTTCCAASATAASRTSPWPAASPRWRRHSTASTPSTGTTTAGPT